ncbi:MAG: hypothetical protein K8I00_00885, partial [Candidatus Omnitrophica bacterium]|nr:hypothetical protein [Candidatus Omnitrophota bacterium]
YWHWLPEVLLSRCPICNGDFRVKFDPIDFHGFWWRVGIQRNEQEPNCCPHFCLLTGAVDRKGKEHKDGLFPIETGPEKPFVIPRVLGNPEMTAVWTSFDMLCGYTAHPIVYFSGQPTSATPSKRAWGKNTRLTLEEAKKSWDISVDEYDFELEPWIEQGKLIKGHLSE